MAIEATLFLLTKKVRGNLVIPTPMFLFGWVGRLSLGVFLVALFAQGALGAFYEHPEFKQNGNPICGQSCLFSVLHKFRRFQGKNEILRITQRLGYNGVLQEELVQSFRSFGFKSDKFTPTTLEELEILAEKGVSFILSWHNGYGLHYSVFEGLAGDRINLMDPNYGHVNYTISYFLSRWSGPAVWVME